MMDAFFYLLIALVASGLGTLIYHGWAARLRAERDTLRERHEECQARCTQVENALATERETRIRAEAEIAQLQTALREKEAWITQANEQLTHQFQALAQNILDDKSAKFTRQNREQLDQLLQPLREKLGELDKMREKGAEQHGVLLTELKHLTGLNQSLTQEAHNLTQALKGDNKAAGNWGELVLERLLESAGLSEGREFRLQASFTDTDGKRHQPDVLILLPEGRHLVLDAKVSLVAYERYHRSEDETTRAEALKEHIASLRAHIKGLSEKDYAHLEDLQTPEFVLLFVPVEPALHLALQNDPTLLDYAFERHIALTSPTTLFAVLKTVASLWRLDRQNRNTEEIARVGGALYDKFDGFIKDMQTIDASLKKAQSAYDEAFKKLHTGKGNLVRTVQSLHELGAKHKKALDAELLEKARDADPLDAED